MARPGIRVSLDDDDSPLHRLTLLRAGRRRSAVLGIQWADLGRRSVAPKRRDNIRALLGKGRAAAAVNSHYIGRMKTVLAPIDLSPISAEVVAHAAILARALRGRMLLLTVMPELAVVKRYAPPAEILRRMMAENERVVQRRLTTLETPLARHSVRSTRLILQGDPTRVILAQAKKTKAGYIVMGSHGHSAFFDLIGGSTLHGVLTGARCPVVIVPPHARPTKTRAR